MEPLRVAIVGCGAIAELGHLPGALACPEVEVTVLIDRDAQRARDLAARFAVPHVGTEFASAARYAEAAVVALPPHLHRSAAESLLGEGLHLLMEKPLATTVEDCDAMLAVAGRANRVLAVAMMRRFARSARYLKAAVESGMLGPIRRYVARSGAAEAWPSRSPYMFSVAESGGGVLVSNGCHDLDMMLWLMGPIATFAFFSDSPRRNEANCLIEAELVCGARATVEVSRTRTLANTIRIEGERAAVEAPLMGEAAWVFPHGLGDESLARLGHPALDYPQVMADQLADFARAVRGGGGPLVGGESGREMIALLQACYARAQPLTLPWDLPVDVAEAA